MGFRIVGYVLIPQGGTVASCSGPRTAPTPPRLCSPLVAQGPRSGPAALPATRLLAAPQTGQSALGLAPRRIRLLGTSRPRRQNHGAVEEPQGWRASLALHFSNDAGSCRAANRTMRFRLGPAPNTVSENIQAAPSKPRRGGKAARLESEPCATLLQPLFNDSMTQ